MQHTSNPFKDLMNIIIKIPLDVATVQVSNRTLFKDTKLLNRIT